MTVKEDIARQIKFDYLHDDIEYSYIELAEKILRIIKEEIDKRIEKNKIDPKHWSEDAIEFYAGYEKALHDLKDALKQ